MATRFRVYKQSAKSSKQSKKKSKKSRESLVGKTVTFKTTDDGPRIAGVVRKQSGAVLEVAFALPNADGVLVVTKDATTYVLKENATVLDAVTRQGDVKAFETRDPLKRCKAASEVKDEDGNIIDYRGVTFEGYGSTFEHITPEDRDGDYIVEGAFDRSIKSFRDNPVMLTDHTRRVNNLMGHYQQISVNERGLALKGMVTDSPHPDAQHVRFNIVEGSLKTLSIGGSFFYRDDYRGIEEIELHETSLVVVPANPDATFQVRSVDADFVEKAFKAHAKRWGGEVRAKIS